MRTDSILYQLFQYRFVSQEIKETAFTTTGRRTDSSAMFGLTQPRQIRLA